VASKGCQQSAARVRQITLKNKTYRKKKNTTEAKERKDNVGFGGKWKAGQRNTGLPGTVLKRKAGTASE